MSTPGFLERQLDPLIGYGTQGSLGYTTTLVTNPSRIETRFQQQSRGYWNLSLNYSDKASKSKVAMQAIHAFFSSVQGKAYGWRFRNFREYYTCVDDYASNAIGPEPLVYESGTTMPLIHTRRPGDATKEVVPILKPDMVLAITIFRDGNTLSDVWPSASNWSLDTTTGIVTFASDQTGHTFYWQGYWDTPCRFDIDEGDVSWDDLDSFSWSDIKIKEIQL